MPDTAADTALGLSQLLSSLAGASAASFLHVLLSALLTLLVCLVAVKLACRFASRLLSRLPLEQTLAKFLYSALRVVLYCLTGIIVAGKLGIPSSSLVTLLGVAALAVSMAMQSTLSNLAGGLNLLITKPFLVGDYVEAGGNQGTVQSIGLVYTKVNTIDNKCISIPNSDISSARIINYSTEGRRRVDLVFSASYDAPVEAVKNALLEIIQRHPAALEEPEPFVRLSAYRESCIDYTIRVWCSNEDYWTLYYDLLEDAKRAFDENGIEMTYNHLNVHLMKQ